jgi:hypothetical protein
MLYGEMHAWHGNPFINARKLKQRSSMAGWHFLKHLTCTFGARSTTLSRRPLMRSSLLPFLFKHHQRVSYHWPSHNIPTKFKIHTAATASSTPYLSVLIHCPKHNAVITLPFIVVFSL